MPSILLVQYSASRDGSAHSGLLLSDGLRVAGWDVHVTFGHDGPMVSEYEGRRLHADVLTHKSWLRRSGWRFLRDLWAEYRRIPEFQTRILSLRPDVVYVNTAVSLAAVLAARRERIPCVWHLRELFADMGGELQVPSWFRPLVPRFMMVLADRLVAPSRAIAENLLGRYAEQVYIVPNAAGEAYFHEDRTKAECRRELGLPAVGPVIGVPGTLRPVKGHEFFFDAAAALVRDRPDFALAIAGHGTEAYTEKLKRQVARLGLEEHTHFLGSLRDMPALYRASDLICVPSRSESFGRTLVEAMAIGTPVVATAVGGIPEIVRDGETGLLVPYGDREALRRALVKLLNDAELRDRMVSKARAEAEQRFRERAYQRAIVKLVAGFTGDS